MRRWLIIGVWVLLALAALPLQGRLQSLAADESNAFKSRAAESTKVDELLARRFPTGGETTTVIAYTRAGGITPADEDRIKADAKRICKAGIRDMVRTVHIGGIECGDRPLETASGGTAAIARTPDTILSFVQTRDKSTEVVVHDVAAIRAVVPHPDASGLRAWVTGEAAFAADQSAAFEGIDGRLLLVTVLLIVLLLAVIYRSPRLVGAFLAVVAVAYVVAAGLVYAGARLGLYQATGQATAILIVLIFGVGTDYCLLLVARYREAGSFVAATRRTILSAGAIVFVVMLVLALADYNATRWMGPVLAIGTVVTVAVSLTLLPAMLSPRMVPARPPHPVWARIASTVGTRPRVLGAAVMILLVVGALGNLGGRGTLDFTEQFRDPPQSVAGLEQLRAKFPPGQLGPTEIITDTSVSAKVLPALRTVPHVVGADGVRFSGDGQKLTEIEVLFDVDPFSARASALIPRVRAVARAAAAGHRTLVGGATAEAVDSRDALRADARVIVPLALVLVLIIVAVLLRTLVAPLYVVGSVLASYAFALGASAWIFTHIFGQPDSDPAQPLFTFVFLVSLGVDYNVFLLARIQEEGSVAKGLERTGGVITSAGLILAGTFCTLLALKLEGLFQVGFTVALGLLVDTFLVRVVLVPSLAIVTHFPSGGRPDRRRRFRPGDRHVETTSPRRAGASG